MDKIRNAISRFGGTVLVTLLLAFVVYNAWGVLVTNSRYPGATFVNVANWPDTAVPLPVTSASGGNVDANVTNTVNVNLNSNTNQLVALPLIRSTFIPFTVTGATAGNTNGNAITPILTFTNSSGIPGTLLSASYWCNTNAPGIVDTIVGFYGTNAPTALGANGAVNMTYQDATNWCGHVEFFNFLGSSSSTRTNMRCTITAPPITILPGVNYLLITANSQWTNNPVNGGNNPTDTLIINWQ